MSSFDPTELLPLDYQLAAAWRTASVELGVRVIAPFELQVGDRVFRYAALVAGFGTSAGVLLRAMPDKFHPDQCGAIWSAAEEAGYTAANVSPRLCQFDRKEFERDLNMYGWFGPPAECPAWYVGQTLPNDDHQCCSWSERL
jgi:hypothetical protein